MSSSSSPSSLDSLSVITINNFIDGVFVPPRATFSSYNPATGAVNALVPDSKAEDVKAAVAAALKAFPIWSQTPVATRVTVLNRIADLIEANTEELAILESRDQGKPLSQSLNIEIPRAVQNFRHFANALTYATETSIIETETGILNYTTHQAAGVVGVIVPWNLPLYLLTFKLAPAIAFGNTVVAKPSELTSVTAFRLCSLLQQSGLPAGVINMVFGTGASVGEPLVAHPSVPLISFTGSTATGKRISVAAAPAFKRLSLEMGGKNAALVFEDFDFSSSENMMKIARSVFFNGGQICLASSRLLVQRSIYDAFVARFVEVARTFKIGDPFDRETKVGPMVSAEHLAKVRHYMELAQKAAAGKGAQVTYIEPPKSCLSSGGYYTGLMVAASLPKDSPVHREEVFGPLVTIQAFEEEEEALAAANDGTPYGLSATVWTADADRLHRVAHRLEVGTVWANCWLQRNLNMPFGGAKASGTGREGTEDSRRFFTTAKTVCVAIKK